MKQKKLKIHQHLNVFHVRLNDSDRTVAKHAHARYDDWGETVLRYINNIGELHAADAVYHEDFYKKSSCCGRDIPLSDEQDTDQYSMDELVDQISGAKPGMKWVMVKMLEKYGERIVFSKIHKYKMVVCFRDVGEKILDSAWYASRINNNLDDRIRVVQTAAAILRTGIQFRA
ncbi:hypothetical protein PR048_011258 [Dryococelus australis]|uniref:Uncharacterized protein n=1 Tax=Dryococelus australis TaxID=614101 RepID=A0ABQ9HL42_9NEOP|nr:hypothetical protein PR048_011258 [Dryococelus australis]